MGCGASAEVQKKGFVYRVKLLGGLNLYNNGFGVQAPGGNIGQVQRSRSSAANTRALARQYLNGF